MASVQVLEGVIPKVTVRSDCLGDQHGSWLNCLSAVQIEKTSLVLLRCSSWQSIKLMVGWWFGYQRGVWSSGLQQKWLSVWMIKICIGDHENTHSRDSMMKQIKPSRNTCSTWLTDGASDKRDTRDWSFINGDDSCMIVIVTLCVSVTDPFIANTTSTYEVKTSTITRTWSQAWLRH